MISVRKIILTTVLGMSAIQAVISDCGTQTWGAVPNLNDCAKYYRCELGMSFPMTCPEGQIFDIITEGCGDIANSVCAIGPNNPEQGQKDLLIVFDATGSMAKDLAQLRSAAIEIVNDLSGKEEDPINNFVLSVFRDPEVEEVFVTTESAALISELNKIRVNGGGDCPELAMLGLKRALEVAAENSVAFLFSDASAKDYGLYEEVLQIALEKQIRVYFLLTGDCGKPNSPENLVYGEIARNTDGQVFNMKNTEIKDVLVELSFMLDTKFEALKSFDFETPGESFVRVNVDSSFEKLLVSATGKNVELRILNSKNQTAAVSMSVSLSNIKIATLEVTDSEYLIDVSSESKYSIRVGGISNMSFDFGFSYRPAMHPNETQKLPIAGRKNILTVFVDSNLNLEYLQHVTLVSASDNSRSIEIPLSEFDTGVYATAFFNVPEEMFKIKIIGQDKEGNIIDRIISTGIEASRETTSTATTFDCGFLSSRAAPHPTDCAKYYECVIGIQYEMTCPEGQIFDIYSLKCGDIETSVCALN